MEVEGSCGVLVFLHLAPALKETPKDLDSLNSLSCSIYALFIPQPKSPKTEDELYAIFMSEAHTETIPVSFPSSPRSYATINTGWQVALDFISVDDGHLAGNVLCSWHVLNASLKHHNIIGYFHFADDTTEFDSLDNAHTVTHFWNQNWNPNLFDSKYYMLIDYWLIQYFLANFRQWLFRVAMAENRTG